MCGDIRIGQGQLVILGIVKVTQIEKKRVAYVDVSDRLPLHSCYSLWRIAASKT